MNSNAIQVVDKCDFGKCVRTVTECGERTGLFIGSAFAEEIPLVSLPDFGQLLYPTAEISLTDSNSDAAGPNLCVLADLRVLEETGWQQIERLDEESSPSFRATGDDGKLFLRFSGNPKVRRRLNGGLVLIEVSCKREEVIGSNGRSKYCIIFKVVASSPGLQNVSPRNSYVIYGLVVCLLCVILFVLFVAIYLFVKQRRRKIETLKVPFELEKESQYDVIEN